jgi:alkylhydroperoxidase family enzyme
MNMMSWGMRRRMNFKNRTLSAEPPDQTLGKLAGAVQSAGMGSLPSYFYQLYPRPHVLAGHAAILTSLLRDSGFPLATTMRIRYLVSCLNGDSESARQSASLLQKPMTSMEDLNQIIGSQGITATTPMKERRVLLFARDVTLHANRITDEQVSLLREVGLSDLQILNLVLIIASYNSANRMNLALAPRRSENRVMRRRMLVETDQRTGVVS